MLLGQADVQAPPLSVRPLTHVMQPVEFKLEHVAHVGAHCWQVGLDDALHTPISSSLARQADAVVQFVQTVSEVNVATPVWYVPAGQVGVTALQLVRPTSFWYCEGAHGRQTRSDVLVLAADWYEPAAHAPLTAVHWVAPLWWWW